MALRETKKIVNAALKRIGLEVTRYGATNSKDRIIGSLINDVENIYRETFLKNLPALDGSATELISELCGTSVGEGFYILNALAETKSINGDCCEFGVAQGATSALIGSAIRNGNKKLWLFDSFEGLSRPTEKDLLKDDIFNLGTIDSYAGKMSTPVNSVKNRLAAIDFPFDRVVIVPGFIENTIKTHNLPISVSFAYVDFDFFEPIKVALEYLDGVTRSGSVVIVDDYDFFSTGAKSAVDEFVAKHHHFVLELPAKSAGYFAILRRRF